MKIQYKLLWVPGLAIALMAVVVMLAASALIRQQDTLQDLTDRQFAANLMALQAKAAAAELHSSAYRLITWVANLKPEQIKQQQETLASELLKVERTLELLRGRTDPALAKPLGLGLAVLKDYRKQALDAVDMASVDANTGMASMQDADASYVKLRHELDEIVAMQGQNAARATAEAAAATSTTSVVLIGVGLLSAVLTAVAALMLGQRIVNPIKHAGRVAEAIAIGDLSHEIQVTGNDETGQLLRSMRDMQSSLGTLVTTVRGNAESVASASSQISQGNNDLSGRTEEQASALEQTSASMKQLASTVRQNADSAGQGNSLASTASQVAARGGEVVGQVVQTMKGINESSRKIADIIGVIDGIAFQTNILALNAAVEAARAGEQGRGFAVVAGEVRTLAQRSADAAKEIKGLIGDSVQRVEQGSALVDQAGTTMGEVVASIREVSDIMARISQASTEQSAGVAQIGEAVTQMDQATQQNAALVEQSAAAAESLKAQSRQLVDAVAVFRLA